MKALLDRRPVVVMVAGPNGAGKTSFFHAHLAASGLRFLNPDLLARELNLPPTEAAKALNALRQTLVAEQESFVFETVFSDPVGAKLDFLKAAAKAGYTVILCFIGIAGAVTSDERVAMRVSQGGHDVPAEKLVARYPRTMANLQKAIRAVPHVFIFDNEDLRTPYRKVAVFENGKAMYLAAPPPKWLAPLLPKP
jgi:predicted ABC-type ATPase